MEGTETVRRSNGWSSDRKHHIALPRIADDAWGPPGIMGRKITGTTPTLTPTTPLYETPLPENEEEYAEYYQDRISEAHNRQLYPLMEDLADWINKSLGECLYFYFGSRGVQGESRIVI